MLKTTEQINAYLQKTLAEIIQKWVDIPDETLFTITRVQTSPDHKHAKIFFTVFPEIRENTVFDILKKNIYSLQKQINQNFASKKAPQIFFTPDLHVKTAYAIDTILDSHSSEQS